MDELGVGWDKCWGNMPRRVRKGETCMCGLVGSG